MKKVLYQIIIITILISLIVVGIKKERNTSTIRTDKRNFSINDTLSISKIELINRNLENITIERTKHNWILNDSLVANQYSVNLLLKTIKEMRVKNPVARSALNNIIKRMSIQNTKVTIYGDENELKTIFVGGETADQLGTFMMLEGAKEPYVMHIPGFNGYLSSRFNCKEELWRDKKIFRNTNKIHYNLNYKSLPKSDLSLNKWVEIDASNMKNTYCEQFLTQNLLDEVKTRQPFITFLSELDGKQNYFYCYRKKPPNKDKYKMNKYDQERFYIIKGNTIMLVQYQQFNNFISENNIQSFKPQDNVIKY